jgi:hypothetical protein
VPNGVTQSPEDHEQTWTVPWPSEL